MFLMYSLVAGYTSLLILSIEMWHHNFNSHVDSFFFHFLKVSEISLKLTENSMTFCGIIAAISSAIFIYSYFYMGKEKQMSTFSNILFIFVLSMLTLVTGDCVLIYLLGWDGLGVSSFLLVVFYSSLIATRSGLATFITNRLGDFFIILSLILLLDMNNQNMTYLTKHSQTFPQLCCFILLLLGAFTKSAQIPFSAWLPAAMAAPTPVSALVHSSTLVTAGLFILANFIWMVDLELCMSKYICLLTVLLSLLAGLMASFESDFKKLVAMSTLSQMGLIGYILFLKNLDLAMFHIFSHATFKSLLFLVVGALMFFNAGFQDIRVKSAPKKMMKIPMILLFCSSMSLMGFFFSSGFFSKDLIILELQENGTAFAMYMFLLSSCILTVCYTLKSFLLLMNTMGSNNTSKSAFHSPALTLSTSFLFLLTLTFGFQFFLKSLDKENFILEQNNKIMGIFIIFLGALFTRMSWNPALKNMSAPTTSNSSDLKIYFMLMTNLNWISNNFVSAKMSAKNMVLLEPIWWNWISELLYSSTTPKSSQNLTKQGAPTKNLLETLLILFLSLTLIIFITM